MKKYIGHFSNEKVCSEEEHIILIIPRLSKTRENREGQLSMQLSRDSA